MIKQKYYLSVMVITAFVLGFVLSSNCGISSEGSKNKKNQQSIVEKDGCEIAMKLSEAFEAATDKIDQSVVPIFAEHEVQVQSPFAGPTDPFRDFFGEEFFKRFF